MNESDGLYSIGDNIVHTYYGVGEVIGIEDKTLNGKTTTYYVVKTKNSTFWMPVAKADNERTRPVVSSETIEDKVVEVLEADPQKMSSHYQTRRKRIRDAIISGDIEMMARLIRDLTHRRYNRGHLTAVESVNLDRLKERLTTEWARSLGTTQRKASTEIRKILQHHKQEKV